MNSRNKQSRVTPKIAICMKYRRKLEYSDIYWKNHILQKLKTKNNWDEGKQFSREKLKHSFDPPLLQLGVEKAWPKMISYENRTISSC